MVSSSTQYSYIVVYSMWKLHRCNYLLRFSYGMHTIARIRPLERLDPFAALLPSAAYQIAPSHLSARL